MTEFLRKGSRLQEFTKCNRISWLVGLMVLGVHDLPRAATLIVCVFSFGLCVCVCVKVIQTY